MIHRLRAWAAARRAERRAVAEYRGAWRNLARLRGSPAGQGRGAGPPGSPGTTGSTGEQTSHWHHGRFP
jgi:hypothetical protein